MIQALSQWRARDVDAEVNVLGISAGLAAAGVSYTGINATGNSRVLIGTDSVIGASNARFGDATITARNTSSQKGRAVSAGLGYAGAIVGAVVNIDDTGQTLVNFGQNSGLYSNGDIQISAIDEARNEGKPLVSLLLLVLVFPSSHQMWMSIVTPMQISDKIQILSAMMSLSAQRLAKLVRRWRSQRLWVLAAAYL